MNKPLFNDRRRWVSEPIRVTPEEAARLFVHHMALAASFFTTFGSEADEVFQAAISRSGEMTTDELILRMAFAAHSAGKAFCAELAEDVE